LEHGNDGHSQAERNDVIARRRYAKRSTNKYQLSNLNRVIQRIDANVLHKYMKETQL
jgi:hypothetical protein